MIKEEICRHHIHFHKKGFTPSPLVSRITEGSLRDAKSGRSEPLVSQSGRSEPLVMRSEPLVMRSERERSGRSESRCSRFTEGFA
jgi:hypothetical protein